MRTVFALLALMAVVAVAQFVTHEDNFDETALWNTFKRKFNKSYESDKEEEKKFGTFKLNLAIVKDMNTVQRVYGVTKFMDMTPTEFKQKYLMPKFKGPSRPDAPVMEFSRARTLPDQFDWKSKGAVTRTYDQGQCGSCWAFSATEAIESQWFLAGHNLTELSPQQIVDCDQGRGDQGCNGGDTPTAYEYVISTGGMEPKKAYPYTGEDGTCQFKASKVAAKISNWTYVTNNNTGEDENKMLQVLYAKGPLSVCVDAVSWQFYFGGILQSTEFCGTDLDHCVLVTGYDNTMKNWLFETVPIWRVRNSWGPDWGEDSGYIYIERGENLCGIAMEVTLPIV